MNRRLTALLLCAAALLSLAACGRAEPEAAEAAPLELHVVTSYGRGDGNRTNFEAAVASYEAKTGNRVIDGSATSNEEWKNKVLSDFMTGSEPDVLFYFTDVDAEPFISAGRVVSIEEIREEYPDYATNMKQAMMAVASDGTHYAVPSTGYWENLEGLRLRGGQDEPDHLCGHRHPSGDERKRTAGSVRPTGGRL